MAVREDFDMIYDQTVPTIFPRYVEFLERGAQCVSPRTRTISDLGIGTGNFTLEVLKRLPHVRVIGIDRDPVMLERAQRKLPNAQLELRDIFDRELPYVDYCISGLTTHHFDDQTRKDKLGSIAAHCKGFVNVDMVLFAGHTFEDAIERIVEGARPYHRDTTALDEIARSIREKDNPFIVYHAYR